MTRPGELDATAISDGPSAAAEPDPSVPSKISRFAIEGKLGAGGMGTVLLAVDPMLDRKIALKVLNEGARADGERRRRFLREAQAMAKLVHDNVIVVHEVGTHEGQDYVAMEYVAGTTLARWQIGRGWREIVETYVRAGRGLAAAHGAGLVHRDFKPENVLIGDDGRVRVTDFGLVAAIDGAFDPSAPPDPGEVDAIAPTLTRTGALLGTPRYMAPEQHLGETLDARADQFAFCVALYEALFGMPPFAGTTYAQLRESVTGGELIAPPDGEVPLALRDAIVRGLARDRAARFASLDELIAISTAAVAVPAKPARRARWIAPVVALVGIAVIAGAIAFALHTPPTPPAPPTPPVPPSAPERPKALTSKPLGHARLEFDDAQEAYAAGRYEEAARGFAAAYEFAHEPQFLYNEAAAQYQLAKEGHDRAPYEAARALFRRYLAETAKTIDATDRADVEQKLAAIEAVLAGSP